MNGIWKWLGWQVFLVVAILLFAAAWSHAAGMDSRNEPQARSSRTGILVELFTSQGCSSCPSADRFLSELAEREALDVIALSFHVDYWNYIGWTDPFSSAEWSERQRRYAKALGGDRIYTPQMIVAGRWEDVGSHRAKITGLLERAHELETSQLGVELSAAGVSSQRFRVSVSVKGAQVGVGRDQIGLWVAVVESGLVTPVGRGENASKTLRNDRVVRSLQRLTEFEPTGAGTVASVDLILDGSWRRDGLSVVAFLQDPVTLHIEGASEVTLGRREGSLATGSSAAELRSERSVPTHPLAWGIGGISGGNIGATLESRLHYGEPGPACCQFEGLDSINSKDTGRTE